jgi:hypothetical protein
MHQMTKEACLNNTNFVEVSTYVKNHCSNIEPEFIEVFRDLIIPICNKNKQKEYPRYLVIGEKLFQYIDVLGGTHVSRPKNLYIQRKSWNGGIDLKTDIYAYEELISKGAKEPFGDEELLRLIKY